MKTQSHNGVKITVEGKNFVVQCRLKDKHDYWRQIFSSIKEAHVYIDECLNSRHPYCYSPTPEGDFELTPSPVV